MASEKVEYAIEEFLAQQVEKDMAAEDIALMESRIVTIRKLSDS